MTKANLEKELQSGIAQFRVYGKASISSNTFPEETTTSKSGWVYKRAGFPVKVGDSNSVYVSIMGGHASQNGVIYVSNKDNQPMQVNWDLRNNEEVLANIADYSFIKIYLEKDDNGKLIEKRFLSEIDAIDYMAEHLKNDDQIYVSGQVEYQRYNGETQRSFNIKTVILDEKGHEPLSEMRQTYLLDEHSLPRQWEKQIDEEHQVTVNAFVPQYIGKENGKTIKKVLALPQQFIVRGNPEKLDMVKKVTEKLFKTGKKVVREIGLRQKLVYGFSTNTGDIKITDELQELIDLGLMTEEQVKNEATVSGRRVDETIFVRPLQKNEEGSTTIMMADKYAPEALLIPDDEDENISDGSDLLDDNNESDSIDDAFDEDDLFG